jgi:16S rRNA processing protein RimM
MPRPDWVEVGRVQRAHGVRGEVRVASSTDNPDRFVPGETVHARDARPGVIRARRAVAAPSDDADRLPLEIEDARGTDENPIIAFLGIETREQAEGLRGFVLEVPGDQLPELEDGEYYLCDLEGLEVRVVAASGLEVRVVAAGAAEPDRAGPEDGVGLQRVGVVAEAVEGVTHDILALRLDADDREVLVPFIEEAVPEVEMVAGYLVVDPAFLLPAVDA